ncbi:MAG: DUF998 domain-containing protein [Thermocrispum sp.]
MGRFLGTVGAAGALGFMVLLHVFAGARIEPVTSTLSNAVFAPGVGWMFPAGVLSMALAGLGAVIILRASSLRAGSLATLAVGVTAVGLLVVALFPTDPVGTGSLSAQIHRYAAAVVMVAVPVAALRVASALPLHTAGRRMLRAAAVMTLAVVLVTGVAIFLPGVFDPARGLIQRFLLLSELVVLALLVYLPARATLR